MRILSLMIMLLSFVLFTPSKGQIPPEAQNVDQYEIYFWKVADGEVEVPDSAHYATGDTVKFSWGQGDSTAVGDTSVVPSNLDSLTVGETRFSTVLNDSSRWNGDRFEAEAKIDSLVPGDWYVSVRAANAYGYSPWTPDTLFIRAKGTLPNNPIFLRLLLR